jgi:hypothetical protein
MKIKMKMKKSGSTDASFGNLEIGSFGGAGSFLLVSANQNGLAGPPPSGVPPPRRFVTSSRVRDTGKIVFYRTSRAKTEEGGVIGLSNSLSTEGDKENKLACVCDLSVYLQVDSSYF